MFKYNSYKIVFDPTLVNKALTHSENTQNIQPWRIGTTQGEAEQRKSRNSGSPTRLVFHRRDLKKAWHSPHTETTTRPRTARATITTGPRQKWKFCSHTWQPRVPSSLSCKPNVAEPTEENAAPGFPRSGTAPKHSEIPLLLLILPSVCHHNSKEEKNT